MLYEHNQIQTRDNRVIVGNDYLYSEDGHTCMVKVLEMEITKALDSGFDEGNTFDCSALNELYSYDGMWVLKNPTIENLMPLMSKSESGFIPMDNSYIKSVCKIRTTDCCRYLIMGGDGFECANLNPGLKKTIDERADSGKMNAIGKNCEGYGKEKG